MTMFNNHLIRILDLGSIIGGSPVAMAGLACFVVGLHGLFAGLHGGPVVAGLLAFFGATLMFMGLLLQSQ